MAVYLRTKGDLKKLHTFLNKASKGQWYQHIFRKYGELGVRELSKATPRRTGLTAESWFYKTEFYDNSAKLIFSNSNRGPSGKIMIAILIQYGHGTRTGGYVEGIDYINPVMAPIFEQMSKDIWEEVKSL